MATKRRVARKSGRKEELREDEPDSAGLKKLSEEADKTLEEASGEIAEVLGSKAVKGSIGSTKLLVELARQKKQKKPVAVQEEILPSLAWRLENEPEWPGTGAEKQSKSDAQGH